MATYDQEGTLLDETPDVGGYSPSLGLPASSSPGLAPLPSEGAPSDQGLDLSSTAQDQAGPFSATATRPEENASPALNSPEASQAATAALGMADFKAQRSSDDQEYLKNLPTAQKIGLMLQSFSAGMEGRPSPIDTMLANKAKREQEFRAEIGTTLTTLKTVMPLVKSMSPGPAKDAFIEQVARMSGGSSGEIKAVLGAMGTAQEQEMENVVSVLDNPAAQAKLVKLSGGDPEKARAMLKDDSTLKMLTQTADQATLPTVNAKLQIISRAMSKMDQFKAKDGMASFTMADLRNLPPQYQLTPAELATADRNQATLSPYGLKTDKTAQAEQEATDKRGPQSDIGKARRDYINGDITLDDLNRILKGKDQKITIQTGQIAEQGRKAKEADETAKSGLTPDAIKQFAADAAKDPRVLTNLGRGTQGAKDLRAVMNQMAEDAKAGGTSIADTRATFGADRLSLNKLIPQLDAVEAFSNNAIQQGKVLKELAQKADTTGIPVIERWIRAGRKEIAGDADVSEFQAQLQLYRTEAAKIITNPNLSSQLTDTARKEVQHFLDGNATSGQIIRVVNRLETDFGIRHQTLQNQVDAIKDRMAGGKAAASDAATPQTPKPPKAEAVPNGIHAGSKAIGFAPDGKRVWQDPNGKKWKE